MQYKCTGIILKTTKLSEADKILSVYSSEMGLVKAVAKGSRKAVSSFGIKAQVLSLCEFLIGKGRNLDIISQSKLINDFKNIRQNYEALTFACFFLDILENIAIKDDNYDDIFELLIKSLEKIDAAMADNQEENLYTLVLQYLWDLIDHLGYKPNLDTCSITHKTKHPQQVAKYYDYENGGITSTQGYDDLMLDSPYQDYIRPINSDTYNALYTMYSGQDLESLEIATIKSTIKLLQKHLEYRIHKEFKTWKLLEPILS